MATAIIIQKCFQLNPINSLPNIPNPGGTHYASTSGASTNAADPPKFAIASPSSYWTSLGLKFLQGPQNTLDNEFISLPEEAMYHGCEGDVVRSAALFLLHPVNQALCAHPTTRGTIKCQSEYTQSTARSDITYFKTPTTPGGEQRAFAVVEFKRRGVVNLSQFRAAEKAVTQARNENYHIQAAMDRNHDTFYDGNSEILMKQCSSYAMTYRTQYIALFNWDSLVLVRFVRMNPNLSSKALLNEGVGDWCHTTLVPYTNGSHTMRAALLGFLAEAWQNTPP